MTARGLRTIALLLALAAPLLGGCGEQRKPVIPRAVWSMRADSRVAVEGRDSTIARIEWPEFFGARTPEALDSLRFAVRTLLLAPTGSRSEPAPDSGSLMDGFISDWSAQRRTTGNRQYWLLDRGVHVLADTLGVVSLEVNERTYTGGAHANTTTSHWNLDANRGTSIRFADVFREDLRDSMDRALEPMFRMTRGVAPDSSLRAAGFWFEDERFHVNENFAFTPGGVLWHFDPYEIAPYSMGPTDFVVPFGVLQPFANPDGPLGARR